MEFTHQGSWRWTLKIILAGVMVALSVENVFGIIQELISESMPELIQKLIPELLPEALILEGLIPDEEISE